MLVVKIFDLNNLRIKHPIVFQNLYFLNVESIHSKLLCVFDSDMFQTFTVLQELNRSLYLSGCFSQKCLFSMTLFNESGNGLSNGSVSGM